MPGALGFKATIRCPSQPTARRSTSRWWEVATASTSAWWAAAAPFRTCSACWPIWRHRSKTWSKPSGYDGSNPCKASTTAISVLPARLNRPHPLKGGPANGLARARRDHLVHLDGPGSHLGVCLIQRLGLILVGLHKRLDVEAGHVEHAHVPEGLLHLVAPQPDVLDDRHDAAEQMRAELDHQRRRVNPLSTRFDVHAEGLEDLL